MSLWTQKRLLLVFLFAVFFTALIFNFLATSISHFLIFSHVLPTNFVSLAFYLSQSSSLSLLFLLSFASLSPTFSFSLSFSFSIFQICGLDNYSKLNTLENTDTISAFHFVVVDSLIASASQDAVGHAISRQKNRHLHLGCHTCW